MLNNKLFILATFVNAIFNINFDCNVHQCIRVWHYVAMANGIRQYIEHKNRTTILFITFFFLLLYIIKKRITLNILHYDCIILLKIIIQIIAVSANNYFHGGFYLVLCQLYYTIHIMRKPNALKFIFALYIVPTKIFMRWISLP